MPLVFKIPAQYATDSDEYDYTCSAEAELTALFISKIVAYQDIKMTRKEFLDFKIDSWRPRSDAIHKELVLARDKLKEALVGDEKLVAPKTVATDIDLSTGFDTVE